MTFESCNKTTSQTPHMAEFDKKKVTKVHKKLAFFRPIQKTHHTSCLHLYGNLMKHSRQIKLESQKQICSSAFPLLRLVIKIFFNENKVAHEVHVAFPTAKINANCITVLTKFIINILGFILPLSRMDWCYYRWMTIHGDALNGLFSTQDNRNNMKGIGT